VGFECEQREMEKREGSGLRGLLPVAPASGRRLSPPSPFFAALGSGRLGQGLEFWVGAEGATTK